MNAGVPAGGANLERALGLAVPHGALFEGTCELLDALGLDTTELRSGSRKLVFEASYQTAAGAELPVRIVTMRPSDVPTYVEYGAADLGVTGKDVLVEQHSRDLYELRDLGFGVCRMVFATPAADALAGGGERRLGAARVATKYPRTAHDYFEQTGRQVEVIEVKGSVELAPLAGLAEGIVDLTASGRTLEENRLEVREEIAVCTARLVANPVSHKLKGELVDEISSRAAQWAEQGGDT